MAGEGSSSSAAAMAAAYATGDVMKKARLQSMLSALLCDATLSDVPGNPSLSDVDALINLELGSAMKITLLKLDSTAIDVAVLNTATVKDLKLAIQRKINEIEQSQMGHRHISWRHVWKNFCLAYHNEKLIDDKSVLQDFGVRNNSQLIKGNAGSVSPLCCVPASSKAFSKKKAPLFPWSKPTIVN